MTGFCGCGVQIKKDLIDFVSGFTGHLLDFLYTAAFKRILLKSYFAWPSCGYLINRQIIIWSYIIKQTPMFLIRPR